MCAGVMTKMKYCHPSVMVGTVRFVALLGGAMLVACSRPAPHAEDIRPVRTVVAHRSPLRVDNVYAGEVKARHESTLGFRIAGKMVARDVNVGDFVHAGQPLAHLDVRDVSL